MECRNSTQHYQTSTTDAEGEPSTSEDLEQTRTLMKGFCPNENTGSAIYNIYLIYTLLID